MNDHIPTTDILKDIADTEAEIATFKREIPALETLGDRMSMFRAGARRTGIQEREAFIVRLRDILKEREK